MKASIACMVYLALLCGGTDLAFADNENILVSIEDRLDTIQYSQSQMFMQISEQLEALTTEIRAVKQSLDHLAWYSEHVTQSVASIQNGNELLLRNVTLLTRQSDEITANQQYCANHEALKNIFFELKPRCGEFHPDPNPPEMVYSSCRDVPQRSGVYRIALNSSIDLHVLAYCEMDEFEGGWTVIQKRHDGSVNFNQSWSDYRNGFGNPSGEYWLGLETIHYLTTRRQQELLIILQSFNGTTKYARYNSIVVDNENQKYLLNLDNGVGTAGDSLYAFRGEKFVTYDVQSGSSWWHCANELASGFWHFSCDTVAGRSNLNGLYGTIPRRQGIWWNTFSEGIDYNPLKRVQMMIREKTN